MLSALLYIGTEIITSSALYPGYSYADQQVSELSAIGAPTRPLRLAMSSIYAFLMVASGIGVCERAMCRSWLQIHLPQQGLIARVPLDRDG